MLSKREVKRQYARLMRDVETKDYYKVEPGDEQINCYKCGCGHITKTKHADTGTTPFMHKCESCGSFAQSTMYTDIAPDQKPTQEWYRPSLDECLKLRKKNEAVLDHVFNGGVLNRKIENVG